MRKLWTRIKSPLCRVFRNFVVVFLVCYQVLAMTWILLSVFGLSNSTSARKWNQKMTNEWNGSTYSIETLIKFQVHPKNDCIIHEIKRWAKNVTFIGVLLYLYLTGVGVLSCGMWLYLVLFAWRKGKGLCLVSCVYNMGFHIGSDGERKPKPVRNL